MMVKERFIERYGVPMFTIGWGSSGGAIQQHGIADNYPGLLDGLITGRSFADTAFASSTSSGDSRLLLNYFDKLAGAGAYTDEQKRAIAGFANAATISNLSRVRAPRYNATERCPEGLPAEQKYDPVKNPKGARCTIWDHGANVYGRDPRTGFARRPLDNTGIQYGLEALNSGAITKEQFLDLNEKIGGFDIDGNIVAARMVADTVAMRAAYRSGRLTNGGGGLATVPIIDYRTYYDDLPAGDVHLRFQSFTTRARLEKANGYSDNHVMLLQDRRYGDFDTTSPVLADALAQMDQWLSSSRAGRLQRHADREAAEGQAGRRWWTPAGRKDEVPQKIEEKQQYRAGRCNELYPAFSFPRGVAGAPIANDIIKCQLKPIAGVRLQGDVHGRRDDTAAEDLPGRRVRLVEARRRAAEARRHLADVQRAVVWRHGRAVEPGDPGSAVSRVHGRRPRSIRDRRLKIPEPGDPFQPRSTNANTGVGRSRRVCRRRLVRRCAGAAAARSPTLKEVLYSAADSIGQLRTGQRSRSHRDDELHGDRDADASAASRAR